VFRVVRSTRERVANEVSDRAARRERIAAVRRPLPPAVRSSADRPRINRASGPPWQSASGIGHR
jgi:hypothetical protein